jgi:hypothetical protein
MDGRRLEEWTEPAAGGESGRAFVRPWEEGLRFAEEEIASGLPLGVWRLPEVEEALRVAA